MSKQCPLSWLSTSCWLSEGYICCHHVLLQIYERPVFRQDASEIGQNCFDRTFIACANITVRSLFVVGVSPLSRESNDISRRTRHADAKLICLKKKNQSLKTKLALRFRTDFVQDELQNDLATPISICFAAAAEISYGTFSSGKTVLVLNAPLCCLPHNQHLGAF